MKTIAAAVLLTVAATAASAEKLPPFGGPASAFPATLSNDTPLVFGMGVADAQRALGTPFTHVGGRPGNEIFLTFRDLGRSGYCRTMTASSCNSARAASPAGRATGARTGCGARAFSSEVDTGSREENASRQKPGAPF